MLDGSSAGAPAGDQTSNGGGVFHRPLWVPLRGKQTVLGPRFGPEENRMNTVLREDEDEARDSTGSTDPRAVPGLHLALVDPAGGSPADSRPASPLAGPLIRLETPPRPPGPPAHRTGGLVVPPAVQQQSEVEGPGVPPPSEQREARVRDEASCWGRCHCNGVRDDPQPVAPPSELLPLVPLGSLGG
ncbi:unnamed protein product [Lota lota]